MLRVIAGAAAAAVAMLIVGLIFFATPLARLSTGQIDDAAAASVQQTLAANLPETGTYQVPSQDTPAQTNMYSRGPIATIHYNTDGFASEDAGMILLGLVFNFIVALLIGAALIGIDRRVPDYGSRARVGALVAVAAAAFTRLGGPIYEHHGWGYFLYLFLADAAALVAAALIVAWFLPPSRAAAPQDAPTDV